MDRETFIVLCVLVLSICQMPWCTAQRKKYLDLCEVMPGYHPNGDHLPNIGSNLTVYVDLLQPHAKCIMRFTTCVNCRISISSKSKYSFSRCNNYKDLTSTECVEGCTYFHIYDPDYFNETRRILYDGSFPYFTSESKTLYIIFCSYKSENPVNDKNAEFQLVATEKILKIKGSSVDELSGFKYISSPFFPALYAENSETYSYEFRAVNLDDNIQLLFDDWHVSPSSSLQFEYTNLHGIIYGSSIRPFVLSNGPILKFNFDTGKSTISNPRRYMGFKASYKFHSKRDYVPKAQTNCGQYLLKSDGGTLMFTPADNFNYIYDCIWVVKPQPGYTNVYTKLEAYENPRGYYSSNQLEIRDGLTSLGGLKASVTPGSMDATKLYGHESSVGFYIRLKGRYKEAKDFILTYASFKYGECVQDKYFKCHNRRCINSHLMCDGYNHCGDNSDEESKYCGGSTVKGSPHSYTLSAGVIIPIAISVFLIIVIFLLIIFIRRCRKLSTIPQDDRQRISSTSGHGQRNRRRRNRQRISMNLTISQDAPPTYEEVIRSTPIGHLNMAFLWSRPDGGMIQPPSYEEATSPRGTDLPQLTLTHNVSSSSSEMTASVPRHSPALSTSTEASYPDRVRQVSSSSSSNSSRGGESTTAWSTTQPSSIVNPPTTSLEPHKTQENDFVESSVSSTTLHNKTEDSSAASMDTARSSGHRKQNSSDSIGHRDCGMAYNTSDNPGATSGHSGRDVNPRKALKEFVARKQREKMKKNQTKDVSDETPDVSGRTGSDPPSVEGAIGGAASSSQDTLPRDHPSSANSTLTRTEPIQRSPKKNGQTNQLFLSLQLNTSQDEDPDIYV